MGYSAMQRCLMSQLQAWKESNCRKPLLLTGMRNVGKTWILNEFGQLNYSSIAYFNFETDHTDEPIFESFLKDRDILCLLDKLGSALGNKISPETLIIFDEIQHSIAALEALQCFYAKAPQYHVVSAASWFMLPNDSFLDHVQHMHLYPLSFSEFLQANGQSSLDQYMKEVDPFMPIPDDTFKQLFDLLKMYMITGGMPKPLDIAIKAGDISYLQPNLNEVVEKFVSDCMESSDQMNSRKAARIWLSQPMQLDNTNKKFLYQQAVDGGRARDYEEGMNWLEATSSVYIVPRCTEPSIPLSNFDEKNSFKLYGADVGILRTLGKMSMKLFQEGNALFTEKHGALSENFVMQSLVQQYDSMPRYWSRANPFIAIDFLLQRNDDVIALLVRMPKGKGRRIKGTSLEPTLSEDKAWEKFNELFPGKAKLALVFSLDNFKFEDNILQIPLFMAEHTERIIELALSYLDNKA